MLSAEEEEVVISFVWCDDNNKGRHMKALFSSMKRKAKAGDDDATMMSTDDAPSTTGGEGTKETDDGNKKTRKNDGETTNEWPALRTPPSSSKKTDFAGRIGSIFKAPRTTKTTTTTKKKTNTTTTKKKKFFSGKDFLTTSAKKNRKNSMGYTHRLSSSPAKNANLLSPAAALPRFASPLEAPSCLISPNGGADFIMTHKSPNSVAFEKHPDCGKCENDEDAPPSAHYLSGSPVASGNIFERKKTSFSPLGGKMRQFPSLCEVKGREDDDVEDKQQRTTRRENNNCDAVAKKTGDGDHRRIPVVSSSPSVSMSDREENVDGRSKGNAKQQKDKGREEGDDEGDRTRDVGVGVAVEKEREIDDDEDEAKRTFWLDQKILLESGQSMNEDQLKVSPKNMIEAPGISNGQGDDDAMVVNDAPVDYGYNVEDDDFGGDYMNGDVDMIEEEEGKEHHRHHNQQQEHQRQEQEVFEGSKAKSDYAYQCSKCNQNFMSRHSLRQHLNSQCGKIDEKGTNNRNECSKCGKVCKNQQGRARHELTCPGKEELERRAKEEADRKAKEFQKRAEEAEEKRRAKEEEKRIKEEKREEARRVEEQNKAELNRREKEAKDRAAAVKQTLAEARLFESLESDRGITPAAAISRVIREKLLKATTRAAMLDDEDCSGNVTNENYNSTHGGTDDDALTVSMRRTRDELVKQLEPTVTGHEDSIAVCLSGARGVGKTAIVEAAIAKLQKLNNKNNITTTTSRRKLDNQQQKEVKIPVVRLSGLLHAEDSIGMREVARQLRPSYQMWDDEEMDDDEVFDNDFIDDIVFSTNTTGGTATNKVASNMRENYNFVEETLRLLEGAKKTAVFVLDDFDLFARKGKKQTFLYSMLDLLQQKHAQIAIIAITSRHDVEEALEKRVKSRFTARYCVVESQTCIAPLVLDERTGKPLKDCTTGKEVVDGESISSNPAQFEEFLADRVRNCLKVNTLVPPLSEKLETGVAESGSTIPAVLFSERGKLAINLWNSAVDEAINTPLVKARLQAIATLDNIPRTASDLAIAALMAYQSRTLFSTTGLLDDNNDNKNASVLSPVDLALALKDFTRNDFVENLKSCSLLELLLCVAAYRLHFTRDRFHFTIATLTQELREMGSVEQLGAARDATDGVVARSFETLLRMKLVRIVKRSSSHSSSYSSAVAATAPSLNGSIKRAPISGTASGAKDWKGVALMCTEKELLEAIDGHPSKRSSLKEFLRHENVATAVGCAM